MTLASLDSMDRLRPGPNAGCESVSVPCRSVPPIIVVLDSSRRSRSPSENQSADSGVAVT